MKLGRMALKESVLKRLVFIGGLLVVLPLALAGFIFVALQVQLDTTWRSLMPTAAFGAPQPGLKAVVVSADDVKDRWRALHDSPFYYPDGGNVWLVAKETLPYFLDSSPGNGWSEAYTVDQQGIIYRFRNSPQGPDFQRLTDAEQARINGLVEEYLANGVLIASDETTLAHFEARMPILRSVTRVWYFEKLAEGSDQIAANAPRIGLAALVRLAAIVGIFVSLAILLTGIQPASHAIQLALAGLSVPLTFVFLIWLVLGLGPLWHGLFWIGPFAAWVLTAGGAAWHLWRRYTAPWHAARQFAGAISDRRAELIGILAVIGGVIGYFSPAYFDSQYTVGTGDVVRYVNGAMYIYDHGYFPIAEIAAQDPRTQLAAYPHAMSAAYALCMWIVQPNPAQVFFPGQQTADIWLLFGGFAVLMSAALLATTIGVARATLPPKTGYWLAAVAWVALYVPTIRGTGHAAETLLWPLLAFVFLAAILWLRRGSSLAAALLVPLLAGLLLTKLDGYAVIAFIVGPWLLLGLTRPLPSLRQLPRPALVLIVFGLLLFASALLLELQKRLLGVTAPDYIGISVVTVLSEPGRWLANVARLLRITLGYLPRPWMWIVHPLLPITLMLVTLVITAIQRFSARRWLVPVGLAGYGLALAALYMFSVWPDVWIQITSSWDRLLVPVVMASGMYTWYLLAEPARRSQTQT